MHLLRISFIFALLALVSACSLLPEQYDETKNWSVKQFYDEAHSALESGDYQTAIKLYAKLEARYPYGRYAQQAQLETAYAHYKAEEPAAAIAAAERFIKLHPRHPHVDYAYYLRGLASFEQGKNFLERFFPQDKSKRDPQAAHDSFRYFKELLTRFPNSRYAQDARQRMVFLRNNLARYEINVADYYFRRGAYLAAVNRAEYVLENYEKTPSVPVALGMMVRAYRKMELPELANDAMRVLELNYPNHPALAKLRAQSSAEGTGDTK